MLGMDKHRAAGRNIFMDSTKGLATVLALAVTLLAVPKLYTETVGWVRDFVSGAYGTGWEDIASFLWGLLSAATVFYIARMSIGTALVMGGLAVATRLL